MTRRELIPRVLSWALILAVVLCLGSDSGQAGDDSEAYRVATGALRDNLWEIAAQEFRGLLRDGPGSEYAASATYYLGFCCFQLQDFRGAEEALCSYLSKWPRGELVLSAKYYLGRSLLEIGQPGRASPLFQDVRSGKGELANPAGFWLGRAFFEKAEWSRASELFLEVIECGDAEYADSARYELGRAYAKDERYAESIEVARSLFKRPIGAALRLQTLLQVATGLANLGRFDEAITEARVIISGSPSISPIHNKAIAITAEAYRMSGRPQMAIDAFRRYQKNEPDLDGAVWAAQSIIECLTSMTRCREANESMRRWANRFTQETICELASGIADCYSASGEHDAAAAVLRFALDSATLNSLRLMTALKLADAHFKASEFSEVILLLSPLVGRGLLNQDKDIATAALLMVAASHEELDSLDEAERAYRLLLSLKPDAARMEIAAHRLVDVLVARGDLEGAMTALNELSRCSTIGRHFVNLAAKLVREFAHHGQNRRATGIAREILGRLVAHSPSDKRTEPSLQEAFLAALSSYQLCDIILQLAENPGARVKSTEEAGLLFAAGECCFGSGASASASTIYLRVIQRFPEWMNAHIVLGRLGTIAFAAGRFELAAERFDAARLKAPPNKACDLLYIVAESLFRAGKLDEAIRGFQEILKTAGCQGSVLQNSYLKGGMIYEEMGKFEKARAAFSACASMGFDETVASIARTRLARLGG